MKSKKPGTRPSGSNPFGNLGERSWGVPFWLAVVSVMFVFAALKLLAYLLALSPAPWLGTAFSLLATPLAPSVGETLYHARTSMQTYGVQRFVLCLLGTAPIVLFTASETGILFALLGWVVLTPIPMFWLHILDKVRNPSGSYF